MKNFIEVTTGCEIKVLINVNTIARVINHNIYTIGPNEGERTYTAGPMVTAEESYLDIKKMIENAINEK